MKIRRYLLIMILIVSVALLASCGDSVKSLPVSYELSGGVNPENAPTEVKSDSVASLASVVPTRANYTFSGWYTDEALTSPLSSASVFSDSVKLYAKWTPGSFSVSFVLNGGKCSSLPSTYSYGEGDMLRAISPTKNNYVFNGWFTDEALTEAMPENPVGDLVLYASFSPEVFDINYELSGGECADLPEAYTYGVGKDISSFIPTLEGYRFAGWYFDEFYNEEGNVIEANFSGDIDVYAKWIRLPEKLADIPDVKKGFFGVGGSSVEINMLDYIDPHGATISYTAVSSDDTVVVPNLYGNLLTIEFQRADATATVSVSVAFEGETCADFEFSATSKMYRRIACVGDSLTSGGSSLHEPYPTLLAEILGDDYIVGNFGAGGTSLTNYPNTTEGDYVYSSYVTYRDNHQKSLDFNPDLVIIMLGTNDTKKWAQASLEYKDAYFSLVETYKAVNPDVEIVVCTTPDVRPVNTMDIPSDVISEYIYPLQLEIAAELGAKVVDFHALIDGKSEAHKNLLYLDDGIHLTRDAAIELAGLIKKTV